MVDVLDNGEAVFRVYLPGANRVRLAGDFTRWRDGAREMARHEDGWWSAALRLEPGDYAFCYFVDEREWIPDYAAFGVEVDEETGQWLSRVLVESDRLLAA